MQDEKKRQHYRTTERPYTHPPALMTRLSRRQDQPAPFNSRPVSLLLVDSTVIGRTSLFFSRLSAVATTKYQHHLTAANSPPLRFVFYHHPNNKLRKHVSVHIHSLLFSSPLYYFPFAYHSPFSSCDPTLRNKLIPWVNNNHAMFPLPFFLLLLLLCC